MAIKHKHQYILGHHKKVKVCKCGRFQFVNSKNAIVAIEKTSTLSPLFWNNQGQIGCAIPTHMPFIGSDTFINQAWERIPYEVVVAKNLKCEVCQINRKAEVGKQKTGGR